MKLIIFAKNHIKKLIYKLKGICPGHYINGPDILPPPFTASEEDELLSRLDESPEEVKRELITHNLRLVVYISKKFDNTGIDIEDLISVGTIGLIKAVNSFDMDKKIKLATYASRCIENEILMHLRKVVRRKNEVSLDEPLNVDSDGNELLLGDVLGTETDMVYNDAEENVEKELLKNAIKKLSSREQQIVSLRFGLGGKQEAQLMLGIADKETLWLDLSSLQSLLKSQ